MAHVINPSYNNHNDKHEYALGRIACCNDVKDKIIGLQFAFLIIDESKQIGNDKSTEMQSLKGGYNELSTEERD